MATFSFPRYPRRDDPEASMVVQRNLVDFANDVLDPVRYYPPYIPRREDKQSHMLVQRNLDLIVPQILGAGEVFYYPFLPRRDDPNGALIVQKNLEALVREV